MITGIFTPDDIAIIARIFADNPQTYVDSHDKTHMRKWVANSLRSEVLRHPQIDEIVYVDAQPYDSVPDMKRQAYASGILKISNQFNSGTVWGDETNLRFRAWHDLIHIRQSIQDCAFNLDGELCAYAGHLDYVQSWYQAIWLFSEIVGQVAYLRVNGQFPEQKLVLANLFIPFAKQVIEAYGFTRVSRKWA